jgi:hypothetical protein
MEAGIHLKRSVEIVLAIQNRHVDVVAATQQRFQLDAAADLDGLVTGLNEVISDGLKLGAR